MLNANRNDDGRWLNAYNDRPDDRWNRDNGFAFAVSQISSFLSGFIGGRVLFLQLSSPAAEHFTDKSAQNAIDAINAKRKISLDKFIYALGIDHVGEETAFDLGQRFKKLENLKRATLEDFQKVPDVGPVIAQSIYEWFQRPYNQKLIEKFKKVGVKVLEEKSQKGSTKLTGKTFVLTGTLNSMSREQAKNRIRELGGNVSSSVSKETDYVITGTEPGSKYGRAQKLGVTILDEAEFLKLLK